MKQRHSDLAGAPLKNRSHQKIKSVERAVGQLDALAKGVALQLMAHVDGDYCWLDHTIIADIRRCAAAFEDVQAMIVEADVTHLRVEELDAIARIEAAYQNLTEPVLEHFLEMIRAFDTIGSTPSSGIREMARFVTQELGPELANLTLVISGAMDHLDSSEVSLALIDDLTGMPNRRAFNRLADRLTAKRERQTFLSVMHIDLDRLKMVNDVNGHASGDVAIRHAARSIQKGLMENDFAARIGGDEFVLVLFGVISKVDLARRARQLISAISEPFEVNDKSLSIGASIGVASGRCYGKRPLERLLNNADLALYSSKNAGRGVFAFFEQTMRSKRDESDALATEIAQGITQGQFVPFFQPQIESRTGKLVGFEALMRWQHPTRGLLLPYHFLPAADICGLLPKLDDQVTLLVLKAMRNWMDSGLPVPQVALNLTAERLNDPDIVDGLLVACQEANVPNESIALEILESTMIVDQSRQIIENLSHLSDAGFRIELDDFGTGHSSVANLRFFKVDRIKIDKSFIKDIHQHSDLSVITASIIGLAHNLRIDVLAEGVEKPEERLILSALGCDHIQGFGVAAPLPEAEVLSWITRTQLDKPKSRPFA